MVTKVYDDATYRRPNFRLIKEFVDCSARMFWSKNNNLYLVSIKYFATDWTKPVSLSVFADILDQLSTLHKSYGPHGDIRLTNMLIQTSDDGCRGCLIDFDFVDMNGNSKYPSGFNVTIEDGKRHPQAIANEEMQMDHDYHSMKAVMEFFKVEGSVAPASMVGKEYAICGTRTVGGCRFCFARKGRQCNGHVVSRKRCKVCKSIRDRGDSTEIAWPKGNAK